MLRVPSWLGPCPSPDTSPSCCSLCGHPDTCGQQNLGQGLGGWKWPQQAFELTRSRLAPASSPAGPQTWSLPKSLIHCTSKAFDLFLLSYSFFFSPVYSLSICPPTLTPPFLSSSMFSHSFPPVFSICFLSCSTFFLHSSLKPWQLLVTMKNDILWRCSIFQPLPILTLSWEQNVPGVLPAEPLSVLQSWLPPMHVLQGCTPTARAFCGLLPTWLALSSFPAQDPATINQTIYTNCPCSPEVEILFIITWLFLEKMAKPKTYVLLSYISHGSWMCLRQQHHCWVGMRFPCICIFFQLEDYMGI